MHTTYRHGALHVVVETRTPPQLTRELRELDERLFVERQLTIAGEEVWCVCVDVGGDRPPVTVLEWRDDGGRPLPELSSGVLERMQRMERDGGRLHDDVVKANRDRIERARSDAAADWHEMGRDMEPRASGLRSAALPRSQALRQSRDKRRARGERI